ncbi:lantibiotic dehydratase [Tistrella mobilis]|uniref:lantibiotic dehydratase n=1 Tax=Tistrella mobilis TaxID=171437 RepID=UPI003556C796
MTVATHPAPSATRPTTDDQTSAADLPAIDWFPLFWMRGAGFGFARLRRACLDADILAMIDDPAVTPDTRAAAFAPAAADARRRLVAALGDAMAEEALFLSNRDAPARIAELTAENLDQPRKRARQKLRLAWSYLQRFAAKNDTASFFGPVAWGRIDPRSETALQVTGDPDRVIGDRITVIEHWVAEALAEAVAADPALAGQLPLILNPGCTLDDAGRLRLPVDRSTPLPARVAAVVRAAMRLGPARPAGLAAAAATEDAAAAIDMLVGRRVLLPALTPAPGSRRPLDHLAGLLGRIGTPAAGRWLDRIAAIEAGARDFAAAAGRPRDRLAILDRLHALLAAAGADRERDHGRMYVGRQPVYEDCARAGNVVLGGPFLKAAEPDLAPVLNLYRRVATAAAMLIADGQAQAFDRLVHDGAADAGGTVDLVRLLAATPSADLATAAVAVIEPVLRQAWDRLATDATVDEIALTPADIAHVGDAVETAVRRLLPRAPQPVTLGLDIASPDLMIAAASPAAIARGDWRLVIGEVHPAVATAVQPVAMPFCPDPDQAADMAAGWALDGAAGPARLGLADDGRHYQRSHIDWPEHPAFIDIALPGDAATGPRRRIRSAEVRVRRAADDTLRIRSRCGQDDDLGTLTRTALHRAMFTLASAVTGRHLAPRLVLGRLVVKRRSWRIRADDPRPGGKPAEDAEAFRVMRRWARDLGLPPAIFAKAPGEPKPVCILLDAPQGAEMLARLFDRDEPIDLAEMSPGPDELWLDAGPEGRVTAEFRLSTRLRPAAPRKAPA